MSRILVLLIALAVPCYAFYDRWGKQRIHATAPPKLTPEEKERLRGLGYIE